MNCCEKDSQLAYIGLGSNLDNPAGQIEQAFELIEKLPETRVIARSSLYRSAPFGPVEQPDFINAVVSVMTSLAATTLLEHLQEIERSQGRIRGNVRWGPRVLDLDLLVYGDAVIEKPELMVPHPGIAARNFVLLPLREIAPDLVVPNLGRVGDAEINKSEPQISRID
jgi:2-amino-4-hydroxy-6-hydroxymethyldihydropteridine diphosphokinase